MAETGSEGERGGGERERRERVIERLPSKT